jgi:hypothetical protein
MGRGLRQINTCRKVPLSFLDDDICIVFFQSTLSTIHTIRDACMKSSAVEEYAPFFTNAVAKAKVFSLISETLTVILKLCSCNQGL